jgi:hypothetical protein
MLDVLLCYAPPADLHPCETEVDVDQMQMKHPSCGQAVLRALGEVRLGWLPSLPGHHALHTQMPHLSKATDCCITSFVLLRVNQGTCQWVLPLEKQLLQEGKSK